MPDKISPLSNLAVFVFVFTKTGGISGLKQRISYDSFTKDLVSINEKDDTIIEVTNFTETDELNIRQIINDNNIFSTQQNYFPEQGSVDFINYGILIIIGNKAHTVKWTDASLNVPDGLFQIAKVIENLQLAQ
jgi:hypothetical protein